MCNGDDVNVTKPVSSGSSLCVLLSTPAGVQLSGECGPEGGARVEFTHFFTRDQYCTVPPCTSHFLDSFFFYIFIAFWHIYMEVFAH